MTKKKNNITIDILTFVIKKKHHHFYIFSDNLVGVDCIFSGWWNQLFVKTNGWLGRGCVWVPLSGVRGLFFMCLCSWGNVLVPSLLGMTSFLLLLFHPMPYSRTLCNFSKCPLNYVIRKNTKCNLDYVIQTALIYIRKITPTILNFYSFNFSLSLSLIPKFELHESVQTWSFFFFSKSPHLKL